MSGDAAEALFCPTCGIRYRWTPEMAGRKIRCAKCTDVIRLPAQPGQAMILVRKGEGRPKSKAHREVAAAGSGARTTPVHAGRREPAPVGTDYTGPVDELGLPVLGEAQPPDELSLAGAADQAGEDESLYAINDLDLPPPAAAASPPAKARPPAAGKKAGAPDHVQQLLAQRAQQEEKKKKNEASLNDRGKFIDVQLPLIVIGVALLITIAGAYTKSQLNDLLFNWLGPTVRAMGPLVLALIPIGIKVMLLIPLALVMILTARLLSIEYAPLRLAVLKIVAINLGTPAIASVPIMLIGGGLGWLIGMLAAIVTYYGLTMKFFSISAGKVFIWGLVSALLAATAMVSFFVLILIVFKVFLH